MSKFKVGDYVRAPRDIVHGAFAKDWVGKVTSVWDGRMVVHTARVNPGWETTDHVGKVHEQLTPSELELASAPLDTRAAETGRFPCYMPKEGDQLIPVSNGSQSAGRSDRTPPTYANLETLSLENLEELLKAKRKEKLQPRLDRIAEINKQIASMFNLRTNLRAELERIKIRADECPELHANNSTSAQCKICGWAW